MVSWQSAVGWSCLLASALADSSSLMSPEQHSKQCQDSACHLDDAMPLVQVQAGVKELPVSSAGQAGAVLPQEKKFAATNSTPAGHGWIGSRSPLQLGPTNLSTSLYVALRYGAMPRFQGLSSFPTEVYICVVFVSLFIYWWKTWRHTSGAAVAETFGEHLEPCQFAQIPHWQRQLIHFNMPFSSCVRKMG